MVTNAPSTSEMLASFRDRIARLEEEKAGLASDIRDLYAEVRAAGFDPKALKAVVKEYMQTETQRAAAHATEAERDIYRSKLGMISDLPLGQAAVEREFPSAREEIAVLRAKQEREREEKLAADMERRKAEADKSEAKRKKSEAALRAAYLEEARRKGFDAFGSDGEDPTEYAGDEGALAAWREARSAAEEQASKFRGSSKNAGDQPQAGAL